MSNFDENLNLITYMADGGNTIMDGLNMSCMKLMEYYGYIVQGEDKDTINEIVDEMMEEGYTFSTHHDTSYEKVDGEDVKYFNVYVLLNRSDGSIYKMVTVKYVYDEHSEKFDDGVLDNHMFIH